MVNIIVTKSKVQKLGGMVILPLKEYETLLEKVIPTYQLYGKEAEDLDKLVESGLREHGAGKTIRAGSLKEALRIHDRKNKRNRIFRKVS